MAMKGRALIARQLTIHITNGKFSTPPPLAPAELKEKGFFCMQK
jgi:hypothetical protein